MERCNRMNIDNEVKCSIKYIYGSIKGNDMWKCVCRQCPRFRKSIGLRFVKGST